MFTFWISSLNTSSKCSNGVYRRETKRKGKWIWHDKGGQYKKDIFPKEDGSFKDANLCFVTDDK